MTEDEWYAKGRALLQEWWEYNTPYNITQDEERGFEYAWELAGREMGIVE